MPSPLVNLIAVRMYATSTSCAGIAHNTRSVTCCVKNYCNNYFHGRDAYFAAVIPYVGKTDLADGVPTANLALTFCSPTTELPTLAVQRHLLSGPMTFTRRSITIFAGGFCTRRAALNSPLNAHSRRFAVRAYGGCCLLPTEHTSRDVTILSVYRDTRRDDWCILHLPYNDLLPDL